MRKFLKIALVGFAAYPLVSESSDIMISRAGSIPSNVILDDRPVINRVQQILRSGAAAVQAILSHAENLSPGYTYQDFSFLQEGSFPGLALSTEGQPNPSVNTDTGTITITFDPSRGNAPSIPWFTLKYSPNRDGNGMIASWQCVSDLREKNLGRTYIAPLANGDDGTDLDPITTGLGWPFDGCIGT